MSRRRHIATLLCLLALWLQMLAPALALSMRKPAIDPSSVICHGGVVDHDRHGHTPSHQAPACDHCLICHAVAGGLAADPHPPFTRLDYPASSPLRWSDSGRLRPPVSPRRTAQPRGPPRLV